MKLRSILVLSLPVLLMGCATDGNHTSNRTNAPYAPAYAVYNSHDYYQEGYFNTVKFNHSDANKDENDKGPVPSAPNGNGTGGGGQSNAGGIAQETAY